MGVAVFSGMIGVTIFGLILTPLFYFALAGKTTHISPDQTQKKTKTPLLENA